jgi:hypothetical protein
MNSVWKKILPMCVISDNLQKLVLKIQEGIVKLAQDVGFKEFNDNDVEELLQSNMEPLTNEDLMATEQERAAEEECEETLLLPPKKLSTKELSEVFSLLDKAGEIITE